MPEPELKISAATPAPSGWPRLALAALIMGLIAFAVFWFNPHKTAEATITHVEVYAPHIAFAQTSNNGFRVLSNDSAAEDDLYVIATVRITDKLRLPIFLDDFRAALINPDGTQLNAAVVARRDVANLETIFPALTPLAQHPMDDRTPIAPGETREGTLVLQFPGLTANAWTARRTASLTIHLTHQQPLVIDFPKH
jgi:hypothetical protein